MRYASWNHAETFSSASKETLIACDIFSGDFDVILLYYVMNGHFYSKWNLEIIIRYEESQCSCTVTYFTCMHIFKRAFFAAPSLVYFVAEVGYLKYLKKTHLIIVSFSDFSPEICT